MAAFNLDSSKRQSLLTSGESAVKTKKPRIAESLQSKRENDRARAKMRINIGMAFERWWQLWATTDNNLYSKKTVSSTTCRQVLELICNPYEYIKHSDSSA